MKLLIVLVSVCTFVNGDLKLTIVHTNDMHSRIDETNAQSGKCAGDSSKCYGGFARVKRAVEEVKTNSSREGRATIFLNAGDTFQGTAYYTIYKWEVFSPLIDMLGIDVMVSFQRILFRHSRNEIVCEAKRNIYVLVFILITTVLSPLLIFPSGRHPPSFLL